MPLIALPTSVTYKDKKKNLTEVVIEPCYPGYGVTLGNALRRVLLSSLPGAAVTHIKIKGVQHEFQTIDFVKEDIVEIILNVKQLRLSLHSEEPVILTLSVKGEKNATAGDIKKNSAVEIANPDMVIATLTDKKAELEMELTVAQGRGYKVVDTQSKDKGDIGRIALDALFSPIRNVGFNIEHVRVGQQTDFEKLILFITTDGSMSAKEAVQTATGILMEQFGFIQTGESQPVEAEATDEPTEETEVKEAKETKEEKKNKKSEAAD